MYRKIRQLRKCRDGCSMNKQQVIHYLKNNPPNVQSANAAVFFTDLVYSSYADSHKLHGILYSPVICYIAFSKMHQFYQFLPEREMLAVAEKMYIEYHNDKNYLKKMIHEHLTLTKQMDHVWQEHLKQKRLKQKHLTKEQNRNILLNTYKKLIALAIPWWYYGVIGEDKGDVIDKIVIPNFAKRHNFSKEEARRIVLTLCHPQELTVFNQERKMFLKLCLLKIKGKQSSTEFTKQMKIYLKEFFWIKTTFYRAELLTTKTVMADIDAETRKHLAAEFRADLLAIDKNFDLIQTEKKQIVNNTKLTAEDKKDLHFAQMTSYWVDQRKLGMMKSVYYFARLFEEIANKCNYQYHDISLYRVKEIEFLLSKGKALDEKTTHLRNKEFMTIYEPGWKISEFFGRDAEELFNLAVHPQSNQIKGVVASHGNLRSVKGKVRIILNPKEEKFGQDEILITSMTRVEYVPLMRKAKAIVTDEGGIACHAAIVSRELGIPCIIGTKTATTVFQDGDIIEIDLEKGIVRKI